MRGGPRPAGRAGDLRLDCALARSLLRVRLRGAREVLARYGAHARDRTSHAQRFADAYAASPASCWIATAIVG